MTIILYLYIIHEAADGVLLHALRFCRRRRPFDVRREVDENRRETFSRGRAPVVRPHRRGFHSPPLPRRVTDRISRANPPCDDCTWPVPGVVRRRAENAISLADRQKYLFRAKINNGVDGGGGGGDDDGGSGIGGGGGGDGPPTSCGNTEVSGMGGTFRRRRRQRRTGLSCGAACVCALRVRASVDAFVCWAAVQGLSTRVVVCGYGGMSHFFETPLRARVYVWVCV